MQGIRFDVVKVQSQPNLITGVFAIAYVTELAHGGDLLVGIGTSRI